MNTIKCPDCGKPVSTRFPMHNCENARDDVVRPGDHVYFNEDYGRRFRITRVTKDYIYYVPEHYGAYYPRGCSRKAKRTETTIIKSYT